MVKTSLHHQTNIMETPSPLAFLGSCVSAGICYGQPCLLTPLLNCDIPADHRKLFLDACTHTYMHVPPHAPTYTHTLSKECLQDISLIPIGLLRNKFTVFLRLSVCLSVRHCCYLDSIGSGQEVLAKRSVVIWPALKPPVYSSSGFESTPSSCSFQSMTGTSKEQHLQRIQSDSTTSAGAYHDGEGNFFLLSFLLCTLGC